ncbi:AraC family transcriptional regulator [Sphingosinicella terrae]|jgi:AraC-like DNA-binding protein|uniref:AraC family transcriptional regulator n=1 Tax=Sphingosinicella terrae TaxID=2172047 RepID=UPI000E0D9AC0|nr:AraC family transcriptional regulator [Sphingosinicella terrae]
MAAEFSVMEQHLQAPRACMPKGKLVLSRMKPGTSVLGAPAPSVKLVLEGEEVYLVDGRSYRVEPGQYLYLDAGADCLGTNRTETTGLCLMLPPTAGAEGGGAPEWSADGLLGRSVVLSTRTSALGDALFRYGREIARNPALGGRLAAGIVEHVGNALSEPLGASRAAIDNLKAAKPSTRRELYHRLERARAYLHDRADRAVTLSELASVANLSQFHLARFFKLAFGQAPIAYHRALRLARAAEFLASGAGSVAEAAEVAGYSDQTALSHAFRKQYGMAPQQWAMTQK